MYFFLYLASKGETIRFPWHTKTVFTFSGMESREPLSNKHNLTHGKTAPTGGGYGILSLVIIEIGREVFLFGREYNLVFNVVTG